MFRKYAQILVVLSSLMCGMHAFARPAQPGDELNAFFNRIIEASSQRTCEATEAALARIPDAEFERAQVLMQSLGADDLDAVHKKIDQIIAKTASCPGAQDAFASRLSRLALQAHLKPGAAPQAQVERRVRHHHAGGHDHRARADVLRPGAGQGRVPAQLLLDSVGGGWPALRRRDHRGGDARQVGALHGRDCAALGVALRRGLLFASCGAAGWRGAPVAEICMSTSTVRFL